ncbi:MAG: glycosyltransferase family 2 protein [Chloroflexota bacterium]|nr:MAG: glycosyltransferase family 2 protein [Chloroflexota bacterium]
MNPSVSYGVVIPTYNRAARVQRAIESVLDQTRPAQQVVVVDDGSTDDTTAALARFAGAIEYVRQPNGGSASARNRGIRALTTDYVVFLDSDDSFRPTRLERLDRAIQADPDAAMFYSDADLVDGAGNVVGEQTCPDMHGDGYREMLRYDYMLTSGIAVRRSCFDEVGLFNESLAGCEDWDMWIRLTRRFRIHHIPEKLTAITFRLPDARQTVPIPWVRGIEQVIEGNLAADPDLPAAFRRRIRGWMHYWRGKVWLMNGHPESANREFFRSLRQHPGNARAWVFLILLSARRSVRATRLTRLLPSRVQEWLG